MLALLYFLVLLGLTSSFAIPAGHLQLAADTQPSSIAVLNAERDPAKRAELALSVAESAFNQARDAYAQSAVEKGDAQLDNMTSALGACVDALEAAHKARLYKKAELKVALLQRRMASLLDEIELPRRGWAEYTNRKLEEIHERMLNGVMRK